MLSRFLARVCWKSHVTGCCVKVRRKMLWQHFSALLVQTAAEKRKKYRRINPETPSKITITENISQFVVSFLLFFLWLLTVDNVVAYFKTFRFLLLQWENLSMQIFSVCHAFGAKGIWERTKSGGAVAEEWGEANKLSNPSQDCASLKVSKQGGLPSWPKIITKQFLGTCNLCNQGFPGKIIFLGASSWLEWAKKGNGMPMKQADSSKSLGAEST